MSRSYRKAIATCGYGGSYKKFAKRQANKQVRKADYVHGGAYYKRIHCSWDICDYKWYVDKTDMKWHNKFKRK